MDKTEFDNLPWDKIKEISETGLFEEVFKRIPKARLQFATKDENKEILVKSALKSLQKSNPNASLEQAALIADLMQEFARKVLEG